MGIERMQEIEGKLSISLRSIAAIEEDDWTTVNGEINAVNGTSIPGDVEIVVVAYDVKDEIIGTGSAAFYADDFMGFDTFSIPIETHGRRVARMRVYPRKG